MQRNKNPPKKAVRFDDDPLEVALDVRKSRGELKTLAV